MAVLTLVLLPGCRPGSEQSESVQLVLGGSSLEADSTVELRFDEEMASPDDIGRPSTNSPLVITPPMAGSFTWLSTRSGAFTPSEPFRMDTRYEFSLRPGLNRADGQAAVAALHRVMRSMPFTLVNTSPSEARRNASSEPAIRLTFNAAVDATESARFMNFRDDSGHIIAADAGPGISGRHLLVTPQKPLSVGTGWRLVLRAGLPAADRSLRLTRRAEVPVGDVKPFIVEDASPSHTINCGPRVTVTFSKIPSGSLTNRWREWIRVVPCPPDLDALSCGNNSLILCGRFLSGSNYTITVLQGLPAMEAFSLEKPFERQVMMPPVDPRLYFPVFSGEQMASGHRSLPLFVMNVPKVRVRAKLMDAQTAIHALRGYGSYVRDWYERQGNGESNRRVDYSVMPGRTIWTRTLDGTRTNDVAETFTFLWNEILEGRRHGIVFLDAERQDDNPFYGERNPRLGTQAMIQLTDLGLVWKTSDEQVDVHVFSHVTGLPMAGAVVKVASDENEALDEGITDASGLAHLKRNAKAEWVLVQFEDDLHAVNLKQNVPLYSFHLPDVCADSTPGLRAMLFSDRDVYRPGETLHLKALMRDWSGKGPGIPTDITNWLTVTDARYHPILQTNLVFNAMGGADLDIALPSGPRGEYQAQLSLRHRSTAPVAPSVPAVPLFFTGYSCERNFRVEEHQPNAFEILLPARPEYAADEKISLPLSARYLFGRSLNHAQVTWTLITSDSGFDPDGFGEFVFRRTDDGGSSEPESFSRVLSGKGTLDAAAPLLIEPEVPLRTHSPGPSEAALRVEVTDLNQQTLTHRTEFVRHSSDFYLGLRRPANVVATGEVAGIEVAAVGANGKPWHDTVKARIKLDRIEWQTVRMMGAGRIARYHSEYLRTNVLEREIEILPAKAPADGGEVHGMNIPGILLTNAGDHVLEITATDASGRKVASSIRFSVSAPSEDTGWNYRNDAQVVLKPDQSQYAPGQTATILVETPINGTALVTVERETVLRSFVTRIEGNAPSIQVPIETGDFPNVFVSVMLVRGSEACPREVKEPEYRVGYCQINVRDPLRQLDVTVIPGATNHLPAETVSLSVAVTDKLGAPVPDAEVVLYAVDEGVLSLTDYEEPDPFAFFYKPRGLRVQSGISLPALLTEDLEDMHYHNKGYLGGGGGIERVRSRFQTCAFWNATLRTDATGRIAASFPAPDSMTRYRVIAVAHTADSRFGHAHSAFSVSKPLMIEPALPRFANITDRIVARAVVMNQTAATGDVSVTLDLDDTARSGDGGRHLSRKIPLAVSGSSVVEFPVTLVEPGSAKWIWKARFAEAGAGSFTDSVQSTLPVGHVAPLLREILPGRVKTTETNLLSLANPQLLAGTGNLTVILANTRLVELGETVSQLLHYPYGCAEQTGSSLMPWILLRDSPALRPVLDRTTNDVDQAIRSGMGRFISMQTQSGGLGYWPHAQEPMLWASAYGGMVLALAQRHGVTVPQPEFDRLLKYLADALREIPRRTESASDLCLSLYALALANKAEPAYHEALFNLREHLDTEDRALLALAILESGGPKAMAEELLRAPTNAVATAESGFGSPARRQAIQLMAWCRLNPDAAQVDSIVEDLMREQKEAHWGTTQGNAWALLALIEYARIVEGTRSPAAGTLRIGDQSFPFQLDASHATFQKSIPLGSNSPAPSMTLLNPQAQRLYSSIEIEVRPPAALQPRQNNGFGIVRRYERLDDTNGVHDLEGLRVGDRVMVTLLLDVDAPARYVVVDDPLPALFEAVNPAFKTQQTEAQRAAVSTAGASSYWDDDFHELRQDRVLFFSNEVSPGNYTLRYVARVRAAGTVTAPSTKIEEMYHPNRRGLSGSLEVSARPLE